MAPDAACDFPAPVHQTTHTRWWTEAVRFPEGLLLVWPRSGNAELIPANLPPEMLARIAPLLNALGLDASNAQLLASAKPLDDPALADHYRLRTTDAIRMQRFLEAGAREELAAAAPWLVDATKHPLLVMTLGSRGLSVLVEGWIDGARTPLTPR